MAGRGRKARLARPSLRKEIEVAFQAMYEEWQDHDAILRDFADEEEYEGGYNPRPDLEETEDPIWDFLGADLDRHAEDFYEDFAFEAAIRRHPNPVAYLIG